MILNEGHLNETAKLIDGSCFTFLGIGLGIKEHRISTIRVDHPHNIREAIFFLLKEWNEDRVPKKKLIQVLRDEHQTDAVKYLMTLSRD